MQIDPKILHTCVHCGLCLPACPTYRLTGQEPSSPRGRIYLMQAVSEGRLPLSSTEFQAQMSQCLGCRACEAVCPSGVRYGTLLEQARSALETARADTSPPWRRALRALTLRGLFRSLWLLRLVCWVLLAYQKSGLQRLLRRTRLLHLLRLEDAERLLPPLSGPFLIPRGQRYPPIGEHRHRVALLTGCVMSTAFARVHNATIEVLRRSGCEVILPAGQTCCGALHVHGGDLQAGRDQLRRNIDAFAAIDADAIVVNAAGCGSTLKEAGHLLAQDPAYAARAAALSAQIRDIHEYLAHIGLGPGLRRMVLRVAYQDPCHLSHAQGISAAPRALLRSIPGMVLCEPQEAGMCCGSAGIYNLTQPHAAQVLGARKIDHVLATGAQTVATANPGCALQLQAELSRRGALLPVRFVVELLADAYAARASGA